jgi:RNA polymerase sigma-70 factor (sigma-E family)
VIVVNADEQAFSRWAGERQLALLRTALLLTGDRHRAEDLVQEALTQVALRWRRLSDGNPEAYARQVIVHGNISWWRKHRREVVLDVYDAASTSAASTSADPAGSVRRIVLDRALAALTPRQRATVVLRYYDDLSERETAEVLGVSVGTVKSQTHLALRRLREASPELAELIGEDHR